MSTTTVPSAGASNTKWAMQGPADQICSHAFAHNGQAHYCTYIHAPELVATLYPASTADEQLVVSYLAALTLWWHLLERELAALSRLFRRSQPLALEECHLVQKRLDRCLALDQTINEAGEIMQSELIACAPEIALGFRFEVDYHQVPAYQQLVASSAWLEQEAGDGLLESLVGVDIRERPLLLQTLKAAIRTHSRQLSQMLQDTSALAAMLGTQPKASDVPFAAVLQPNRLLSYTQATLRRHHPQAIEDEGLTDPLVFVVAHQLFEVWFPAEIAAQQEVTQQLSRIPAQALLATERLRRCVKLVRLWRRMIHLPQSMSPREYVEFRGELEGGSGAESVQFRMVEMSAGLRSSDYRAALEELHLLTPHLETHWASPSMNDALLELLIQRQILARDDSPDAQAQKLAAIMQPTGARHPHADLNALCLAALALDEEFWLFRHDHLAMVRHMIGGKPSIGAGGVVNHDLLTQSGQATPVGGLPYLASTTHYRFFPLLSRALEHLNEHWRTVASVPSKD